jgi:PGF-CTERM protein
VIALSSDRSDDGSRSRRLARLAVLAVVAVALVGVAVSGSVAASDAAASAATLDGGVALDASAATVATAERTVADTEVAPGGTTTVEVVVETDGSLGPGELVTIEDEFSAALAGVSLADSSPAPGGAGAPPSNDGFRAVWNEDADTYVLRYVVAVPTDAEAGDEYEITGSVSVAGESKSLPSETITVSDDAPATTSVRLSPAEGSTAPGEETIYEVVVTGADEGVGSYSVAVSTGNASVGKITGVDLTHAAETGNSTVDDDGSRAVIEADLGENAHAAGNAVVIAEVSVAGGTAGATAVSIEDGASVANASGGSYGVSFVGDAALSVSAADDPTGTTAGTPGGDGTATATETVGEGGTASATGTDDGGAPGMGILAALASLLGGGYLLSRRRAGER